MNNRLRGVIEEELQNAYERGVQDGIKQEHAMWVPENVKQKIEEDEYCPHGIRHERHCKSCECIEQAEMRGEL